MGDMTGWNDEVGDYISGIVIAVHGNAITIQTDDGKQVTLGVKK